MPTTFIKSGDCTRVRIPGGGEAAEIANRALCGAKNVLATLRWLTNGDRLEPPAKVATHQLIYLMEGKGVISLNGKDYPVSRGAGIYLGPNESAAISAGAGGTLKLLHLVVPEVAD
jgi:NADH dehydrogenase FAD-containing subunit